MDEQSISLHRHELYDLVWSEPMTRLAGKYGFSDVWLAKICKKYNIPRPGRGYWAKKKAGERISVTRLPKRADDPIIDICIYPARSSKEKEPRSNLLAGKVPNNIVVADILTGPHPLIKETAKVLASSKADDTGIIAFPVGDCLDVRVSRECVDRALRILDSLLKTLLTIGVTIAVSQGSTIVNIGNESLEISLYEALKRRRIKAIEHNLEGYYRFGYNLYADRAIPSGILVLTINDKEFSYGSTHRRTWKDTEARRLEDCLSSFVSGLIKAANIKNELKQKEAALNQTPNNSTGHETGKHI